VGADIGRCILSFKEDVKSARAKWLLGNLVNVEGSAGESRDAAIKAAGGNHRDFDAVRIGNSRLAG
jgi:hypothetical protein